MTISNRTLLSSKQPQQDKILSGAFDILTRGIARNAFPGAVAAVISQENIVALRGVGRFTFDSNAAEVSADTIFDLASVSKVVATTSMAMILYERGHLDLETPVFVLIPEFDGPDLRRRSVTVRMLLAHSSGLPGYEELFLRAHDREALLSLALATPLTADPGTRSEYSDIGFIILGAVLEGIADESLDGFCQREIFGRLGMSRTAFNPPPAWRSSTAPTADDKKLRKRVIQGEVQDENASVLGGVAGHAGVFSTAGDLAMFAHAMLHGGPPLVRPQTLTLFTRREHLPPGTSRALGWDTPSSPSQSGKYFSANSFGHLGYTGCSIWIDPEQKHSIVLLTNRTWPNCDNDAIKEIRPLFHDAVIEALRLEGAV